MARGVTSVAAIFLFLSSAFSREVVNFDFAWRYNVYPQLQCPSSTFLYNVSDLECYGLNGIRASTPDLCRDACCAQSTCQIWQFTYGLRTGLPCKVGISNNCTSTKLKVVGQRRQTASDPSPKPADAPQTSKTFADSTWEVVDVPHDSIMSQPYHPSNELLQAFLPKNLTWYRKHFNLPVEWKGMSIWLYFEGVFRASSVYLNGNFVKFHESGYTSFTVRLDNATDIVFGEGKKNENVIAIRCLASGNYGWWYEGSGIYRHVHLVATNKSHFVPDTIYVSSNITGPITPHVKTALARGVFASVSFGFRAYVVNDNATGNMSVIARFTLYDVMGRKVGSADSAKVDSVAQKSVEVQAKMDVKNTELWSNLRPYLYTLQVELISGSIVYDSVNISVGSRSSVWNPKTGYYLNGVHLPWRGFNNHNHFTGVGIAASDRIHLFQVQSMRAIGGNAWRTSYNPPSPVLLDLTDRLGIMVWDETREFGKAEEAIEDFESLVQRDRNHPSVMVWSICNSAECNIQDWKNVSQSFKASSKAADPSRPVSANMLMNNASNILDIQGLSRAAGTGFDLRHKMFPGKPLIGSECCACPSQRGEDDRTLVAFGGFNANCIQQQSQFQLARPFVAGCLVYTLFDHFGEENIFHSWPHVSSSFGAFDIAGFPKASAYWYRTWWRLYTQQMPATKNEVPVDLPALVDPVPDPESEDTTAGVSIHIVQHWDERPNPMKHTVYVYTNAPQAELEVNGKSEGMRTITNQGWAQWPNIIYIPGTLKAYAFNAKGDITATHTVQTAEMATKIVMGVDVPSPSTGTGSALVLDGQDTGLVHAAVVDSKGNLFNMASNNITFKVVSGPGRIIGVGNGNPSCLEPNKVTWRSAHHGLTRAIVQVTVNQALAPLHRKRLLQIDADGGVRTRVVSPGLEAAPVENIVVQASSEGLISSQVTIPVTSSIDDSVLSVSRNRQT